MVRKLPLVTPDTAPFWQGGRDGRLHIHHCDACGRYFHPPAPVCPRCASLNVAARAVSGNATVATFTINRQAWTAELKEPYVVAAVEIAEEADVRLVTNIVGIPPENVHIGMPVRVAFLQVEDVWLPLFEKNL